MGSVPETEIQGASIMSASLNINAASPVTMLMSPAPSSCPSEISGLVVSPATQDLAEIFLDAEMSEDEEACLPEDTQTNGQANSNQQEDTSLSSYGEDSINTKFEVFENGTTRGNKMLVEDPGYSYTVKRCQKENIYWWCTCRNKQPKCHATVIQKSDGSFIPGNFHHTHQPQINLKRKIMIRNKVKRKSRQSSKSATALVKEVLNETGMEVSEDNYQSLKQTVNREKRKHKVRNQEGQKGVSLVQIQKKKSSNLETSFNIACWHRHDNVVEYLLEKGCDVNKKGKDGFSPLHILARLGNVPLMTTLIKKGAIIDIESEYGNTPLIEAADEGKKDAVELLLQQGANVNKTYDWGRSALHEAALHGNFEIVRLLLAHKADVNFRDKHGLTPINIASRHGHLSVLQVFEEFKHDISS